MIKLRIAVVTYALQIGGVESYIRLLGKYFLSTGNGVDIIEVLKKGVAADQFREEGFSVHEIFQHWYQSASSHVRHIGKKLREYDVVLLIDVPRAQSALGLLRDDSIAIPVVQLSLQNMLETAVQNAHNWDAVVCVSPAIQKGICENNIKPKNIQYIPNSVEVPQEYPRNIDSAHLLKVLFAGAITHSQKGVLYIPEIIRYVQSRNRSVSFMVVGDGADIAMLKSRCNSFSKEVIQFYGNIMHADVLRMMRTADVLLFPSHFEGLPFVVMEAMANGVVPVASLLPDCTDRIITDQVNGFLVPVGDIAGFGKAISLLAENRSLLNRYSIAAWKTIKNDFSYQEMGQKYLDLIDSCRKERLKNSLHRTGELDLSILGKYPTLPRTCVRPIRVLRRLLHID